MTLKAKHVLFAKGLPVIARQSPSRIVVFLWLLEHFAARLPRHKKQLRELAQLVRSGHPALQLIKRLFTELHPNVREKLIEALGINAVWEGEVKRRLTERALGFRPPFLMVISPTMRCNLHCLGCYAGKYPKGKDPLSFDDLDRLITEGKKLGIYFYTISGGEPFIRKDLLDLYELHNDCSFQVYTNGTLIDDKTVERLQKLGNVAPALSVEGFEAETDARRGKGVFKRVMETMDALREAGIMFGFSTTYTRLNVETVTSFDFVDMLIDKGAYFGWYFMFVPVGQDDDMSLVVTPEQRDRVRSFAMEVRRTRPIFLADFWNDGPLTDGCMSGGTLYLHINYRGDVEPCVFLHFAVDNIKDVWARGGTLATALNSDFFKAIRDRNRRDPNRLRPCMLMDHNEHLEYCVNHFQARPTHPGAEGPVTRLKDDIRTWAREYAELAERAWNSGEYDWAKKPDSFIEHATSPQETVLNSH